MKQLTDAHLATLRRHMVEVIDIEYELMADATGRARPSEPLRAALCELPRHLFVPPQLAALAYRDQPLPIGFDKTISQPFLSALMIDLLDLKRGDRVLEVGTGLGYQTALLSRLAGEIWSVDVVEEFVLGAAARLRLLDVTNVTLRVGDGSRGQPGNAPFDAVLVSAAARELPTALAEQLAIGGRMVLPIGEAGAQRLTRIERISTEEVAATEIMAVQFTALETIL
jgi:protein-L-isoaspartate(D-aspartate) O-methyltransferase